MEPTPVAPERPRAVSRRALARGIAWSVPTLAAASAAPALAASRCEMTTVNMVKGTTSQTSASTTLSDGTKINATRSSSSNLFFTLSEENGSGANGGTYNFNTRQISTSGLPVGTYLELNQKARSTDVSQVLTFTLPKKAYCVEFWVTDIDLQSFTDRKYGDRVTVSGFTGVASNTSWVTCSGATCTTAFVNSPGNKETSPDVLNGAVRYRLTSTSGITSFTLSYSSAYTGSSTTNYQQVWISPISYSTTAGCNCFS